MTPIDLLAIGHFSHDTLIYPGRTSEALGGSVAYISSIWQGLEANYSVLSKVGKDFKYSDRLKGLNVRLLNANLPNSLTTNFISDFTQGERRGRLGARCADFTPQDLPSQGAKVALACGIVGEIPPPTLIALSDRVDYLICDIQGLIRETAPGTSGGAVHHRRFEETGFAELLPRIDYLKASRDEIRFLNLDEAKKQTSILLTQGPEGCSLIDAFGEIHVPAQAEKEVDSTGAGDCFLAGFAYALSQDWPMLECLKFANTCGAKAVTQIGVPKLTRGDFGSTL